MKTAGKASQHRAEVDWTRLFQEGVKITVVGQPASLFMAPGDESDHLLVLMLKAPKEKIELLKGAVLMWGGAVKSLVPTLDTLLSAIGRS